jgi:D-glycero-alpha-D-manno-heptose-7-phosphate kinase
VIISKTPLRISFAGGGTDFPDFYKETGGAVISTTIDKHIYVMVNPSFDGRVRVNYSKKEDVDGSGQVRHDLVREALKLVGISDGVEISTMADVPSDGSGLGSSSALTVGLLNALYRYRGITVSAEKLAQEACWIEIDRLGAPIGKQDQYACSYGGLKLYTFCKDGQVVYSNVGMSPVKREALGRELMLFHTGVARSARSVLTEQKARIPDTRSILQQIGEQVYPMRAYMTDGPRKLVGMLLHEGWQLKKQLAQNICTPAINTLYQKALLAGATGGKISGAGGGGFILLHVPVEKQDPVRLALGSLRELQFEFDTLGSQVILDEGERWQE